MNEKIPRERYIPPEKRQKTIDDLNKYNNAIMEYQKIINLLDDTSYEPSKFRTKKVG